jgi:arsenate reductase
MLNKKRVLIFCTGNSARSQMAEGLLRHDAGDRFEVFSAGTKPSHVRAGAIAVMREPGIDISRHRSKSAAEFKGQQFDYVLTVCNNASESCPIFAGRTIAMHQNFEDLAARRGAGQRQRGVDSANQLNPRTISAARSKSIVVSLLHPTNLRPRSIRNLAC